MRPKTPCDVSYLSAFLVHFSKETAFLRAFDARPLGTVMTCEQLAGRLAKLHPDASAIDIARLSLLILNACDDSSLLRDEEFLQTACRAASFRLEAVADQHLAMSCELELLCQDGPVRFSPDQIWTLLRAVKVQSQLLELYTQSPALV
jgi:hypothetical protein